MSDAEQNLEVARRLYREPPVERLALLFDRDSAVVRVESG